MGYDYTEYFEELYERISGAVRVPFREVRLEGWQPMLNDCHGNVDRWIESHPGTKGVRGWLFWPPDETGRCTFMAHSVLDEDAQLVDITPLDRNTPREGLVFLKHLGTEEEFAPMKKECAQVPYPPMTQEEWQQSQLAGLDDETIGEFLTSELEMP